MRSAALCVFGLIIATGICAAADKPVEFARKFGLDLNHATESYYANASGTGWQRFSTEKLIPELNPDEGELARVWKSPHSPTVVMTESTGEDFAEYTSYCFNSSGTLTRLHYQLRTAWGWGYNEERVLSSSSQATSQFFDERTEKEIKRPEQADDIRDALRPQIYTKISKLPFYGVMIRASLDR